MSTRIEIRGVKLEPMLAIILSLFRFVRLRDSGHQAVAVENLALRLQTGGVQKEAQEACADAMGSVVLGRAVPSSGAVGETPWYSFSDHFIVLNARHLKGTLAKYFRYYHRSRRHLALDKQFPVERQIMKNGVIVESPELGGLHHRYERVAA